MDILRKYLLSSVAWAPDRGGAPAGDTPGEDIPEPELDEPEGEQPDDGEQPDGETEDDADNDVDDPDDAEGDEPAAGAQPAPRGARQFGALREKTRQQSEEIARLTRERDEALRRPAPQQQPEDPRIEADRVALMSPEERIQYNVDKALARHRQQSDAVMGQLLDNSDRTAFDALGSTSALARKLGPEVERELAGLRARGQNLPRQVILQQLIGARVMAQQGKKQPAAQQRRRQNTARPAASSGDVPPERGRRNGGDEVAAMERRLGNQEI